MTSGLTFQHINKNSGVNTILSYCSAHVSQTINTINNVTWAGDLTYDKHDDKFYFLSYNGLAKIDPQFLQLGSSAHNSYHTNKLRPEYSS